MHRYGTVSTEQFVAHAEKYAATSLRSLFTAWLYERALPKLPAGRSRR